MNHELKKLLPLAAKAAGYESKGASGRGPWLIDNRYQWWAPHCDKEHALRLARHADLFLDLTNREVWGDGCGFIWGQDDEPGMCMAIVRAAAEKGRAM